jgi:hypothetical protein
MNTHTHTHTKHQRAPKTKRPEMGVVLGRLALTGGPPECSPPASRESEALSGGARLVEPGGASIEPGAGEAAWWATRGGCVRARGGDAAGSLPSIGDGG